jgi:hypothetical protein
LCSITLVSILANKVVFVGVRDITITTTLIMAIMEMALPRTSALIVIPQVRNLDNRDTGSPLVLPLGQHEILDSKVTLFVGIIAM